MIYLCIIPSRYHFNWRASLGKLKKWRLQANSRTKRQNWLLWCHLVATRFEAYFLSSICNFLQVASLLQLFNFIISWKQKISGAFTYCLDINWDLGTIYLWIKNLTAQSLEGSKNIKLMFKWIIILKNLPESVKLHGFRSTKLFHSDRFIF